MSEHDSTLGEEEIQSESTMPEMPAEADTDDTDGDSDGPPVPSRSRIGVRSTS